MKIITNTNINSYLQSMSIKNKKLGWSDHSDAVDV